MRKVIISRVFFLSASLIASAPVCAFAASQLQLAMSFGDVLGAETACGMDIDPAKVESFIQSKVDGSNLEFMSTVHTSVAVSPGKFKQMSPSLRSAHCTQMKRLAKSFKILRD
jgi:hypothetical protein